jgi:hypothetical protein
MDARDLKISKSKLPSNQVQQVCCDIAIVSACVLMEGLLNLQADRNSPAQPAETAGL